jgi:hypothetical protein
MANPLDPFVPPVSPTRADQLAWIGELADLPRAARARVAGLTDAQLATPFRPGGWTVRQVVHHMADSHANGLLRVRWALTEDRPTIKPYDQDAWAELHDARTAPLEPSLRILDGVHARLAALFSALEPRDFARPFVHPETGPSTVAGLAALYAWHGAHHLAQIERVASGQGWRAAGRP